MMPSTIIPSLKDKILSKEAVIGVIGMGNIGLTLLEAFGKAGFSLVGYDTDQNKVEKIKLNNNYLNHDSFKGLFSLIKENRFEPSSQSSILQKADVIVISVPTPLDIHKNPDLTNLRHAFNTVVENLKKGQLIILQSSTYPGTTENELLPLLEKSKLKVGKDFYLVYVPEMFDIGNEKFSFAQIPRIIGGITPSCLQLGELLYEKIGCKVIPCSTPKIGEAAKLLQNTYRFVNISLINEMKVMFDYLNIDIWEVIEAASHKPFGFTPFYPSVGAGGDCIPVSPGYLIWKARNLKGATTLVETSDQINDAIYIYVVDKVRQCLVRSKKSIKDAKILVLGVTYKKDINDIRNAPSLNILDLLKKMHADVHYHDPYIESLQNLKRFPDLNLKSEELNYEKLNQYDVVLIVTDHSIYNWSKIVEYSQLIVDTRNVTANIPGAEKKVIKA